MTEKGFSYESNKHLSLETAVTIRQQLSQDHRKMIFTNGCFDLIHPGHIRLLYQAKEMGDFLLVGLNSDASIKRLKGEGRPIMPLDARLLLLCSMEMVDGVLVFEEDAPLSAIKSIRPDCYVKGAGWRPEQIPEIGLVTSYGGQVVLFESLSSFSTTGIVHKIQSLPTDFL